MKYRTIVVDPPWPYEDGCVAQGPGHGVLRRDQPLPYAGMSLEEIRALKLPADVDSRCFLWTTNRYLPDAFSVLWAWGFSYRQTLVWHKVDTNLVGSVAPNSAEFLLVGVHGKPERLGHLPASVIASSRKGGHSAKAELWLDYIESISPPPRLEMFARRNRLGWDTWGNEALEHVEVVA